MNLDLLIKLIKLANHNNADHEANTAARRVCKMIEEDFTCLVGYVDNTKRRPAYQPPAPPKPNPMWTEPAYPKGPFTGWFDEGAEPIFADILRKMAEEAERARKAGEPRPKPQWSSKPPSSSKYYSPDVEPIKQPKPKKNIVCTKCKKEILTGFVGPPQVFVCTECQWEQERETTFVSFPGTSNEVMCAKCRFTIPESEFYNERYRKVCPHCERKIL